VLAGKERRQAQCLSVHYHTATLLEKPALYIKVLHAAVQRCMPNVAAGHKCAEFQIAAVNHFAPALQREKRLARFLSALYYQKVADHTMQ
jgi:hypothetical protein